MAFNLNLAEPVAIGPTLWWGLFGPPPLMVFILVSGLLGWFAVNVEPMSGHGIALALVALLAVPVLLAGDHPDEPEPAFSYGAREIQRDPLSLAPEPRQEPLVEPDPGYADYAREIVSIFLRSILLFAHLVYMPAWVLGLGQDMFGGAKDWPGKTVQELYSGDFLEYHLVLAAFFTVGFFALLILGAAFPGLRRRRTFTSADND